MERWREKCDDRQNTKEGHKKLDNLNWITTTENDDDDDDDDDGVKTKSERDQ